MSDDKEIETEIEHTDDPVDHGIETEFTADEVFDFHGEIVERETTVAILEDGGVHITQTNDQGSYDSLTLSGTVADELVTESGADE